MMSKHGIMVLWGFNGWVLTNENLLQFQEGFIRCIESSVKNNGTHY